MGIRIWVWSDPSQRIYLFNIVSNVAMLPFSVGQIENGDHSEDSKATKLRSLRAPYSLRQVWSFELLAFDKEIYKGRVIAGRSEPCRHC